MWLDDIARPAARYKKGDLHDIGGTRLGKGISASLTFPAGYRKNMTVNSIAYGHSIPY